MSTEILQVDYRYIILDDQPSAAAAALATLLELGIGLVGFSEFPHGPGTSQLSLIAEDSETLARTVTSMGLTLSRKKIGFLIRGENKPGAVVADILARLAEAHIRVTSLQAVSAGAGHFGALLWVNAPDVEEAGKVLGASVFSRDLPYKAPEESFPASDASAWTMAWL